MCERQHCSFLLMWKSRSQFLACLNLHRAGTPVGKLRLEIGKGQALPQRCECPGLKGTIECGGDIDHFRSVCHRYEPVFLETSRMSIVKSSPRQGGVMHVDLNHATNCLAMRLICIELV